MSLLDHRASVSAGPLLTSRIEQRKPRARWVLHLQAVFWRYLMGIGMFLHKTARPRPPKPSFVRSIPTTIAPKKGNILLYFYVPKDYETQRQLGKRKYPVVVNFHGGGFTLGDPTDDARWCGALVSEVGAIAVSVGYRLSPEHPFPTAVEDGVDAILYLAAHAADLNIDLDKIAVSGFSSGANMAFTVPLRLQEELEVENAEGEDTRQSVQLNRRPALNKAMSMGRVLTKAKTHLSVKAVVSWYPPTDYTNTREQRKATCKRLDKQLPAVFTNLFDESYLQPPTLQMDHPYLSPGVAPLEMLAGLPEEILLFTCEWDMLLAEGERFRDRLTEDLDKKVHYFMIPDAPHGWDKAPNPITPTPGVDKWYGKACKELKRLLNDEPTEGGIRRRSTILGRLSGIYERKSGGAEGRGKSFDSSRGKSFDSKRGKDKERDSHRDLQQREIERIREEERQIGEQIEREEAGPSKVKDFAEAVKQ